MTMEQYPNFKFRRINLLILFSIKCLLIDYWREFNSLKVISNANLFFLKISFDSISYSS